MGDKISNWYEKIEPQYKRTNKPDKNFKKHYILPNSMMCCIGGTGSGKTNALIEFLSRKNEAFYDVIYFNPVSSDEPLLNMLKDKLPEMKMFNNIEDLPELSSFEDEEKDEKLIIFDDIINMPKKEFKKVNEYLTGGRKMGFTCFVMGQNYVQIPKTITRNSSYFIVFRLNDNVSINNIIRNHNTENIKNEEFKRMYLKATESPRDFFLIDLKSTDKQTRLRHNFLNFFELPNK